MDIKRAFIIVLDSLGAGEAPDAERFGDVGAFTLRSISASPELNIPNLVRMGIGNIDGLSFLGRTDSPSALCARMTEASEGKDTTIGHWEIAGKISHRALPTFPDGFPAEIVDRFTKLCGRGVLCNLPYSGTKVIADFGEEHLRTGSLILYTSADSVFQIAAHESIVPTEGLYDICRKAREILVDEYGVGRVIARPFAGEVPNFYRTDNRRDFSLEPDRTLLPEAFFNAGLASIGVGKIGDIFADKKFTKKLISHSNAEGMQITSELLGEDFRGLCFVNLVDFDMKFGHRRDVDGYARALTEFDLFIGEFIKKMRDEDILFITADHGCDPAFTATTDHTREYTPLLVYSNNLIPENLGTRKSFADIAATISEIFDLKFICDGTPLRLNFKK